MPSSSTAPTAAAGRCGRETSVAWGIEKGASPTATNHDLIKRIYATTAAAGINLKVTWHPREAPMAVEADRVSKIGDVHGWSISARDFSCMSATLGLPDVNPWQPQVRGIRKRLPLGFVRLMPDRRQLTDE